MPQLALPKKNNYHYLISLSISIIIIIILVVELALFEKIRYAGRS